MYVLQCLIVTIFGKDEYEFLMGAALAIPFLFDATNSLVTTSVYDSTHSLTLPWYIGCGVCVFSLLAGIWTNMSIIGNEDQSRNKGLN